MDVDDFVQWWRERERADIERIIHALDAVDETVDGAIGRVRAGAAVAARLRRSGRSRAGCRAAHRCCRAALDACARTGVFGDDRDGATKVARAAGEAARALVAQPESVATSELLAPFGPELAVGQLLADDAA